MLVSLIEGVVLGLSVAVPFGPLNVLIFSYALKGYSRAFCIGFGAMIADAFYLVLLSFGMLKFLNNQTIFNIMASFGSLFLLYMAFGIYKSTNLELKAKNLAPEPHAKILIKGIFLNFTNPFVVIFWLSMTTLISSANENFLFILTGLVIGILTWIVIFPLIVYKNRSLINAKFIKWISIISAMILAFFAIMLIFRTFLKGVM